MRGFIRVLLLAGFLAAPAFAQDRLAPANLPPDTMVYVYWRGLASQAQLNHTNSLLALWNDPDFLPFHAALAEGMLRNSNEKNPKKKLTPAEIQEFTSLLENPMLAGAVEKPKTDGAPAEQGSAPGRSQDNGFYVLDISGKEAFFHKLELRWAEDLEEAPSITKITIGNVPAEQVVTKTNTSFRALSGHYAVGAGSRPLLESVLLRIASPQPGRTQLSDVAAYREAQKQIDPGSLLEVFLRLSNITQFIPPAPSGSAPFDARRLVQGFRPESLHGVVGGLKLNGPATRARFTILGDTAPGSIFDLFANGDAPFVSLTIAPANTISYSAFQTDFGAFYETLRRAVTAALASNPQFNVDVLEGFAASSIGMKPLDALHLLSGEIASLSTSADLSPENNLFALGIQKKPEVLSLLRSVLGDKVSGERNEGDVTYLKISLGSAQGQAGGGEGRFYQVAATPNLLLGASTQEALEDGVERARAAASSPSGGLAAQPAFRQARARFPQKLNSIGYADFSKVNWSQVRDRLVKEAQKAGAKKNANADASLERLKHLDFAVFRRHLHTLASASWKDSTGVDWDAWVE